MDIAKTLKRIQTKTGLSQEKLASRLGVSFTTVSRWLHGKARPSSLALARIAVVAYEIGVSLYEDTET